MTKLLAGFALGAATVYALMRRPRHWRSVLAELRGYVDAVDAQRGGWVRVEDGLPEPGETVLCWCGNSVFWVRDDLRGVDSMGRSKDYFVARQLVTDNGERWADEGVTHWRPLPPGPDAHDAVGALLEDMRRIMEAES